MRDVSFLGEGRNRLVFGHNGFVIKVPKDTAGYFDNEREARISRMFGRLPNLDGVCYARCHLLPNGWLVMERVVEYLNYGHPECPEWGGFIDCCQVGKTKDGRVVAYDYGY